MIGLGQVVFAGIMALVVVYGLLETKTSPLVGLAIAATAVVAGVVALFPGALDIVGKIVGLLDNEVLPAVAFVLTLLIMVNLHLKNRRMMRTITALTREIAMSTGQAVEAGGRRAGHAASAAHAPIGAGRSRRSAARSDGTRKLARTRSVTPVHPEE